MMQCRAGGGPRCAARSQSVMIICPRMRARSMGKAARSALAQAVRPGHWPRSLVECGRFGTSASRARPRSTNKTQLLPPRPNRAVEPPGCQVSGSPFSALRVDHELDLGALRINNRHTVLGGEVLVAANFRDFLHDGVWEGFQTRPARHRRALADGAQC